MPLFQNSDLAIQIPDSWEDRSIVVFAAPRGPDTTVAPNVVITRDKVPPGEGLVMYAERQLIEISQRLAEFRLLNRSERKLGTQSAIEITFSWQGASGVLMQRQLFVLVRESNLLTVVLTSLEQDYPRLDGTFDALLSSVAFF